MALQPGINNRQTTAIKIKHNSKIFLCVCVNHHHRAKELKMKRKSNISSWLFIHIFLLCRVVNLWLLCLGYARFEGLPVIKIYGLYGWLWLAGWTVFSAMDVYVYTIVFSVVWRCILFHFTFAHYIHNTRIYCMNLITFIIINVYLFVHDN